MSPETCALIAKARNDCARASYIRWWEDMLAEPEHVKILAAQIRRRRRAALRLPPLANGKRDPLDP